MIIELPYRGSELVAEVAGPCIRSIMEHLDLALRRYASGPSNTIRLRFLPLKCWLLSRSNPAHRSVGED
jgi:hypothetical protein